MVTIPKTMKSAILTQLNAPLEIADITMPESLTVGQVLVKIHYSGICGSQIGEISGVKGEDKYLPHLLGHEASGIVIAIGLGVKHVKPNDKVVLHWMKGKGIESDPPAYFWNGSKVNAGWITTFNEYAIVSENRTTKIPDNSNMDTSALFGCAVTTGFGVVENNAKVRIGESVVVFGAGGIGLNIIQAASLVSAYPIIAIDLHNNRLELAKTMGATHVINGNTDNAKQAIENIIGKSGVDVFIDNTGQPTIIELGYDVTSSTGRIVLVGVPRKNKNISIYSLPLHFGKNITGSHGGETVPHIDIPRYQKILELNNGRLKPLITSYFKLEQINEAIHQIKSGNVAGRCLIKMGD